MFVEVAFPLPLNRSFHYQASNGADRNSYIGRRVLAPFGKKSLVGYVIGTQEQTPPFPTKPIHSWIDSYPFLDKNLLDMAEWLAEKYLCSTGEALAAILPPQLKAPKRLLSSPVALSMKEESSKSPGETFQLTTEQQEALIPFLKSVESKTFQPFLLRGVTDSGKTELYVRTIDAVLKQGRQALFLLPEIALTPPFIDRFKARYSSDKVGIWHSGVSAGERYRTWERAHQGDIQVVLGARSAVFTPFPKLGVIVLDEEHEPSYKQEDRPRYHAREAALWRAERAGATLIMGSATPSLESYWKAKQGAYALVELTSRVEMRQLPPVTLVDRSIKKEEEAPKKKRTRNFNGFAVFSEPLKLALEQRLARREQTILFVNRRGFTPFVRCSKCGWVARCERCSIALTEHLGSKPAEKGAFVPHQLHCHACLRTYPVPIQCPSCKGMRLGHFGIGTQRVEEEVKHLFPFVKIARLDRDIDAYRRTYEKVYRDFAAKKLDVLVGTQIIAKGFDFPGVTLVGVVDADVSLHLPDFRAAERTFQLMAQVAGRTGRGIQGGKVVVQTHHPDHYALQAAKDHDYLRFYAEEIPHREALNYPPYCKLVHLLIRGRKEGVVKEASEELVGQLEKLGEGVDILGPAPAPHSQIRSQFRYQIVLKGNDQTLVPYLAFLRGKRLSKAFLTVDVDPASLA
jgi:primosomal protein N' (replication factor Y) (superfamily II helicase)